MCDCIRNLNILLIEKEGNNTRISTPIFVNISTGLGSIAQAMIVTEKRDTRNRIKPDKIIASYCPFCGKKYPAREKEEDDENQC